MGSRTNPDVCAAHGRDQLGFRLEQLGRAQEGEAVDGLIEEVAAGHDEGLIPPCRLGLAALWK